VAAPPTISRLASDGSPYPERGVATFERDVRRMFAHLSARYQTFNHLASMGNDLLWRPLALWELDRFRRTEVRRALDLGCGTGDFARAVAARFPSSNVVALDFTREMVRRAKDLTRNGRRAGRVDYGTGNALRLPLPDGTFDLVTNAFVARNLRDLPAAFREMRRVLKPGGIAVTLEISEPVSPAFGRIFHAYFDRVVPMFGRAVANEGPSKYLPESLHGFPPREEVLRMMRSNGFPRSTARTYSLGIATVFLGEAGSPSPQSR